MIDKNKLSLSSSYSRGQPIENLTGAKTDNHKVSWTWFFFFLFCSKEKKRKSLYRWDCILKVMHMNICFVYFFDKHLFPYYQFWFTFKIRYFLSKKSMDLISLLYDKINELVKHQTERDKGHDKKKVSFALMRKVIVIWYSIFLA